MYINILVYVTEKLAKSNSATKSDSSFLEGAEAEMRQLGSSCWCMWNIQYCNRFKPDRDLRC